MVTTEPSCCLPDPVLLAGLVSLYIPDPTVTTAWKPICDRTEVMLAPQSSLLLYPHLRSSSVPVSCLLVSPNTRGSQLQEEKYIGLWFQSIMVEKVS